MKQISLPLCSGTTGILEQVEIDTNYFKGNFPNSCEAHAIFLDPDVKGQANQVNEEDWTLVLPRTKLGPHRQHYFQLENVEGKAFTHVKLTIYPDGGLQRIRIIGRRSGPSLVSPPLTSGPVLARKNVIPVIPLTAEAFAPFGRVLRAYGDQTTAPKGTRITPANGGSATKFHKLALVESSYPSEAGATTGISIYRCNPLTETAQGGTLELKNLERHRFTNQAFIPMGQGSEGVGDSGGRYLVVVAQNDEDQEPDMGTLKAFVASSMQGIVYDKAIWRECALVGSKRFR